MDLRQLLYFRAIVEGGSISAAARTLHISQPPLSTQIKNLEAELETQLLVRGSRKVELTDAGRKLYQYAVQMLDLSDTAQEDIRNTAAGQKIIRLGMVSSSGCREFFDPLADFKRNHSDISFRISESNTYDLLDQLTQNKIEMAVVRTPFSSSEIDSVPFRKEQVVAAGTEELLSVLPQTELRFTDLKASSLLLYRRWEKIIRHGFESESVSPQVFCVGDDARTVLQWASSGLGIALVPESVLDLLPGIQCRKLDEPTLRTELCLVRKKHRPLSKSAELFWAAFRSCYPNQNDLMQ